MEFQAITTDMGEATKYAAGTAKRGPKLSELLRLEREKLFKESKSLAINEVRQRISERKADKDKVYQLKPGTIRKYGRKIRKDEYKLPKYGKIVNARYVKHTPEHDSRIDVMVKTVVTEFSAAFGVPESDIRGRNKDYHVTRVRNITLGFLYAHVNMDRADLERNFDLPNYSMFRDRYRQMQYFIERLYFARHYSKIYKKLKHILDYDYDKNGSQFAVNRRITRYSRRSGRNYKLCKGSKARQMVGRAEA